MKAERERREAILRAEGEKKSTILVAEGKKESAILEAEAEKQSAILRAEAEKEKMIREAEGEAEAILKVQQATANGLRFIKDAGADDSVLRLKSLEALEKVADGKAVGFWRKMSGQSKRTRGKELLVSCSFSLLMKGQTLFSADHLAFKGLILLICRFSDI